MVNSELIILGMIHIQPTHGYLLKKNVQNYFGNPNFKLNNNVLYSTLKKLEKNGLIMGKETTNQKINKKIYHITENGEKHLIKLVAAKATPDIEDFDFKVKAVFFDLISKDTRIKTIKPLYEAKLNILNEALNKKKELGSIMSPVSYTVLEYGIKELQTSIEFYEKLMDAE